MNITCIVFGILFILFGCLFALGKIHIHMTAWKNMSQDEKDKIRIRPLCLNIGEVIILNGLIFLAKGIYDDISGNCFNVAIVIWMIIAGIDIWVISNKKIFSDEK